MSDASRPVCVRVFHELPQTFRHRFHLVTGGNRGYVVWTEPGLGFRICSGERVIVQVRPGTRIGWSVSGWPRRLDVLLAGEPRGSIMRPPAASFRRDVLTLDRREYALPDRAEPNSGELGMGLSWGGVGGRPSISIRREDDLPVGLLVLAYAYARELGGRG